MTTSQQPAAYVIEVSAGPLFGEEVIRSIEVAASHDAPDLTAIDLIEGFRTYYGNREEVTWDGDEVDALGILAGLAPNGISYRIQIKPPLPVEVSPPTQPTLF